MTRLIGSDTCPLSPVPCTLSGDEDAHHLFTIQGKEHGRWLL